MSDMIERVGDAIHAALTKLDFEASHMTPHQLEGAARAAIEAMREPTEPMIAAARTIACMNGPYSDPGDEWGPMIDAALGKVDA